MTVGRRHGTSDSTFDLAGGGGLQAASERKGHTVHYDSYGPVHEVAASPRAPPARAVARREAAESMNSAPLFPAIKTGLNCSPLTLANLFASSMSVYRVN